MTTHLDFRMCFPALRVGALLLTAALVAACATTGPPPARVPSRALPAADDTVLGATAQRVRAPHGDLSGFDLLERGEHALQARMALATLAERSIDAQYFIWSSDKVGRLLGAKLLAAAERGVRVRVLVDDFYIGGRDARIALFSAHPNVEVRVFNPIRTRRTVLSRAVGFIANFRQLNHRMHNKLFLVDGAFGVAGGRNVADEYYGVDAEFNMLDRDVLATGPVMEELSASFDRFWNSSWSVPLEEVASVQLDAETRAAATAEMLEVAQGDGGIPYSLPTSREALRAALERVAGGLTWADAEVYHDDPDTEQDADDGLRFDRVREALMRFVRDARDEVLIQSPYLIPERDAIGLVAQGVERGIRVRVLTNSLASTDMVPAQAVYARMRPQLLRAGAEVHELRPDAAVRSEYIAPGSSREDAILGLHAKTIVADRKTLYVGTYNLDRRSAVLNTEVAIIIRSPALAARVADSIERDMHPDNSWRAVLEDDGEVAWQAGDSAEPVRDPPLASPARLLGAGLISVLPIDDQL